MTSILRIQEVLAESPESRLPAYQLAARAGIATTAFHKHVKKWLARGHLSREKVKGKGYCYYLTDQQLQVFRVKKALGPGVRCSFAPAALTADVGDLDGLGLVVDTEEVPERLRFLRMLKEKTVFGEHATLALIIGDYERTLKLRMTVAQRVDEEDKRGRPRARVTKQPARFAAEMSQ